MQESVITSWEKINEVSPKTLEELIERLKEYFPNADVTLLKKAYEFSEKSHSGQFRRSGEPYILHPVGVAGILIDLHLDMASIITGLLHDTVEDTHATLADIEKLFGKEVAQLVDGVTKISQIEFKNTHEKQGENIRKMIVAMSKDVRVVLVKLSDRLHNMRTLNHMAPEKQVRISQETLDIYAPLANRLGISSLKVELEDLSLRYLMPDKYYEIAQKVAKTKKQRERYIEDVKKELIKHMQDSGVPCEVQGRPKHLYSIYKKMEARGMDYDQIYDILAFRVLVNSIPECYSALGQVHSVWKPIPGRFKDFIAMAKSNNYQSLHTTVIGPGGEQIEIQIRTREMHLIAERGIAAHWKYKEGGKVDETTTKQYSWFRDLVNAHKQSRDADEFLENIKSDLFDSEIYLFTPNGDVKVLPEGATPIDFAYDVHTDVGNKCIGAKINGRIVQLRHKLKSGDTIEILTSPTQQPSKDWLKFCITGRAQSKIRWHVRNEERKKAVEIGKALVEKEFRKYGYSLQKVVKENEFSQFLKDSGMQSADDIFMQVGYGKLDIQFLIKKVVPDAKPVEEEKKEESGFLQKVFKSAAKKKSAGNAIVVDGVENMLVRYAKCCNPIPGDPIVGFISRGRGVTVHTASCNKAYSVDSERKIDVSWTSQNDQQSIARIKIVTTDSPGQLNRVSEALSQNDVNIVNARVQSTKDKKGLFLFDINVKDSSHLTRIIINLQKVKGVLEVHRV